MHGCLRLALLAVLALAAFPSSAAALDFTVDSTSDAGDLLTADNLCRTISGTCTLRAAVQQANVSFGPDSVTLPPGTYLTGSTLTISKDLTITGSGGARATVIDGIPSAAVFTVAGAGTTTLRGVTITGGRQGIAASATDLALDQVTVRGNTVTSAGSAWGGGIYLDGGQLLLTRSTVTDNHAVSSGGSDTAGGGIVIWNGQLTALASTISANTTSGGTSGYGGGILVGPAGAKATLRHVTLTGNTVTAISAASDGGGLYLYPSATATVADSVLSANLAGGAPQNCGTTVKPGAAGRNIDSGTTCGFGAGQLSSTDPQLEPLGDHGGPTDTAPPALASPARDGASACPDGAADQRGAPAPTGPACDIGAAELSTDLAVSAEASRSDAPPGADVTYLVRVTNTGSDDAPAATLDASVAGASAIPVAAASSGTCTTAVHCDLGTLARGATVTVTIVARTGAGGLTLNARAATTGPDASAANDQAVVTTPGPAASGPAGADTTAPALGPLKLSGKARRGRAATLRTTLSEDATVTLKVERLRKGRRAGKRCLATARRGKPCTIARTLGTVKLRAAAGSPKLLLPAKLARRTLAAGRHRITATAVDAAGNRSRARTLVIVVVSR